MTDSITALWTKHNFICCIFRYGRFFDKLLSICINVTFLTYLTAFSLEITINVCYNIYCINVLKLKGTFVLVMCFRLWDCSQGLYYIYGGYDNERYC